MSPLAPGPVKQAASDVARYLGKMGLDAEYEETGRLRHCIAGIGVAALLGDSLGQVDFGTMQGPQTFEIDEQRCGNPKEIGGVVVRLSGKGLLARQYAAYEWLHRLGVRFFHPEQEYVPDSPCWPVDPLKKRVAPSFKYRGVTLHLTHPLALGDAFSLHKQEYLKDALNYMDWEMKNFASLGHFGVSIQGFEDYGHKRGFPWSTGINLYGQQQGNHGIIDPDDQRSEKEQIIDAIESRLNQGQGELPDFFSFTFNPTEFTEVDDVKVVENMKVIADYMAEHYPSVQVMTTNHGTHGEPTKHYKVRYFDLPEFAPANLGVKCHTLMFYDLFRPAPVYGNKDFHFMYDFMEREYRKRRLWYFPESAWWLTFDNQVPLYLPITIEARDRDFQGIKHMLDNGLEGALIFGTGHEWGYWQNEYCFLHMALDTSYRYTDCLKDLVSPMGRASPAVLQVMEDLIKLQENEFIYGNILRYLVGTDPETEAAYAVGVKFHPMPPAPREIGKWTREQVDEWLRGPGVELQDMDESYSSLLERMDAVRDDVPKKGIPWFDEVRDGIAVTGLRARHQYYAYNAMVTFRKAKLELSSDLEKEAMSLLEKARAVTGQALTVIHRREKHYRYKPLDRYIAGGPDCNRDGNWTTYPYRVHCRTHTAYYWTRIDDLAEEAILAPGEVVTVKDTMLVPTEKLEIKVRDPALSNVSIDFGDGNTAHGASIEHVYSTPGIYAVSVTGERDNNNLEVHFYVAVLTREYHTGFTGKVQKPDGMGMVEPLMPAMVFGNVDNDTAVVGFSADDDGNVKQGLFSVMNMRQGNDMFDASADYLNVPMVSKKDAAVLSMLIVADARGHAKDENSSFYLEGMMSVDSIVEALVVVGGGAFDEEGARRLVAGFLGYTVDTLPDHIDFTAQYAISESRP
ncbi:MAG: hypothetical protein GXP49_09145 [Deltaproteobacteria bacterium]|nr:hypothetical protein [Deltaproteobacteria bacterium]